VMIKVSSCRSALFGLPLFQHASAVHLRLTSSTCCCC
jgi:hypothetical protein